MRFTRAAHGRSNVGPYHPWSIFNRPIVLAPGYDSLKQDQSEAANFYIQSLGNIAANGPTPGLASYPFSVTFIAPGSTTHVVYAVRPSVAAQNIVRQKVGLYYTAGSTVLQYGAGTGGDILETYLTNVPIPDPSLCPKITGTGNYAGLWVGPTSGDRSCFIHDLDTDKGYEFWEFGNDSPDVTAVTGATWNAKWGGYIPSVSNFNGIFAGTQGGVNMDGLLWGTRACSIGQIGGLITNQDQQNVFNGGGIDHALAFACAWTGTQVVPPATRSDARGGPYPVNQATRLRFWPGSDYSATGHPMGYAIGRAIEKYGMICMDSSSNVGGTGGIGFYIEDDHAIGSPYDPRGAGAVDPASLDWVGRYGVVNGFQVTAADTVLNHLPWSQLQVLNPIAS